MVSLYLTVKDFLNQALNKVEESVAKGLFELESGSNEFKKDLKNFLLDNVKEVEIVS